MMISSLKQIAMFSDVSGCMLTDCHDPAITIYAVGLQVNHRIDFCLGHMQCPINLCCGGRKGYLKVI